MFKWKRHGKTSVEMCEKPDGGLGDLKRLGREFEVEEVIGCYEELFSFLPDSVET